MAKENKRGNQNTNRTLYLDLSYLGILIFLLFRIPLTNIIGNEGNGYFSVTWELYTLMGLFFGHCFYNITKEMIQLRVRKKHYKSSVRILIISMIVGLIFSITGASVIYVISDSLLNNFGMHLSSISFRFIGILLIFTSLSGVLGGYFEGNGTKIPGCFSKILESIIAGSGAIIFSSILFKYGGKVGALLFNEQYQPAFGATGILIGCFLGSILAFIFLIIVNFIYQKSLKQQLQLDEDSSSETKASIFKDYFKYFIFALLELVFLNLFRITNMRLYIKTYSHTDSKGKIVQYLGSYHGKILVITGILAVIVLIFTGRNVKRIQKNYYKNKLNFAWKYFCNDLKEIVIFAILIVSIVAFTAQNILAILYDSTGNTETIMLKIGSINILLIPLAVYLSKLMIELDFKLMRIISPGIAFFFQTFVMWSVVRQENIGPLSLVIADVVFWMIVVIFELLVIVKALKWNLIKFNTV